MNFDPMTSFAQAQESARASRLSTLSRNAGSEDAARETAQEFEAFFISHMLDSMTAGLKTEGPFNGGHAEQMWRGVMNQEYGKAIARSGSLGIADQVYDQMIRMQAAATAAEDPTNDGRTE